MKRVSKQQEAELESSVPAFQLLTKDAYEEMAAAARSGGESCTWADMRAAHMLSQFPKRDAVHDTASVRAVYLWYLAYQKQLVADLASSDHQVVHKAQREIERLVSKNLVRRFDRVRGGSA